MNPYYANWSYGYTLQPSSEATRGAYGVQYGGGQGQYQQQHHQHQQHHHQQQGGASNWSQIKGNQSAAVPKAQVFVTASPAGAVKSEPVSTTSPVKTEPTSSLTAPTIKAETTVEDPLPMALLKLHELAVANKLVERYEKVVEDPLPMALLKLHELAVANKLVERYEKVEEDKSAAGGTPSKTTSLKVVLFLGNEIYQGTGNTIKSAKQQAAVQALQNTKYQTKEEKKATIPTLTTKKIGVTATSELYEWATKKGVYVDFKFLEPYNFEFKHSMRMWDKKEMLGNYRVQLNVAGYEFYGQAELPQQAKHNAAIQALPIVKHLPDPTGTAAVVAKPGGTAAEGDPAGSAAAAAAAGAMTGSCGTGGVYEKNVNMALNEIAMQNGCVPEWQLVSESGPQHQKRFTWQLTLGPYTTCGTGNSKKIAKQTAAEQMMATLPEDWKKSRGKKRSGGGGGGFNRSAKKRPAGAAPPASSPSPAKKKPEDDGKIVITADNPVSCLYEYAKKKKIPDPEFDCIAENLLETWQRGNQTMKKIAYTIQLKIDSKTYLAESNTKKAAKQACAAEAWNSIRATLL